MATAALRPLPHAAAPWGSEAALVPLLLFATAFVLRSIHFGDPAFDLDAEFYLFVGDRLLHGTLPYVDIWDRKPIGLFLLYAAIRLLGGAGIWQYQLVATLFAGATAWAIARLARPVAGRFGSVAAGLAYLIWIETVEGGGGQAPIFYNLLVALAAERVLAAGASHEDAHFRREGRCAMLLAGLAIQIKYTVVCETFYFGLTLAWWSMRRGTTRAAGHVALLAGIALAPTIAALAVYAAAGHGAAFWFANFVSVFARSPGDPMGVRVRLGQIALQLLPFAICWGASLWEQRDDRGIVARRQRRFVIGWVAAALAGFSSIGTFYFHYALPLFVPLAVAAAPIFRRRPIGPVLAGVLLWLPLAHLTRADFRATEEHRRAMAELTAFLPPSVDRRCLQLFSGPPTLYLTADACPASRYAFPDHLIAAKEARGLGIDRAAEIDRLFERRPAAIVIGAISYGPDPALDRRIRAHLARLYRLAGSAILDESAVEVFVPR